MDPGYINAYAEFYQNSSICSEDIEEKHIFTPIKGHNSCFYKRIAPICNPKLLLPDTKSMQSLKKNGQNLLKRVQKRSADGRTDAFFCGGV